MIFIYLVENILQKRPEKTDIAVIMYTSGSTGTPKG
jgi:long-subunit acyl-CoA synthetase (AMP-forming)